MERLVSTDFINEGEKAQEALFIEGIIEFSSAYNFSTDRKGYSNLTVRIDNFKGKMTVSDANYRIDCGERVRLYAFGGFEGYNGEDDISIDGIQILDDSGKVKFQSVHTVDAEFK